MEGHIVVILLTSFLGKSGAQTLTQSLSMTRLPNKTVRFECEIDVSDFSSAVIHWYRQSPGQGLQRMLYYKNPSETAQDITNRVLFAEKRPATKSCSLLLRDIREDESGMYYCALWDHTV
ncbi:hypothetical protein scyTo_0021041 [Scyliorhinus torazame]|uniref:Ig-like domain-containing protein n=1 Tax=Scyliorhinus torazame TaxID=75743 RepID=A0A401PUP6_SCYTO|nr:hypothetical protein [Scyliorhinus torazame]